MRVAVFSQVKRAAWGGPAIAVGVAAQQRRARGQGRTVDNFVAQLRSKLEADPDRPKHLLTVRGSGYRFVSPPADHSSKTRQEGQG